MTEVRIATGVTIMIGVKTATEAMIVTETMVVTETMIVTEGKIATEAMIAIEDTAVTDVARKSYTMRIWTGTAVGRLGESHLREDPPRNVLRIGRGIPIVIHHNGHRDSPAQTKSENLDQCPRGSPPDLPLYTIC